MSASVVLRITSIKVVCGATNCPRHPSPYYTTNMCVCVCCCIYFVVFNLPAADFGVTHAHTNTHTAPHAFLFTTFIHTNSLIVCATKKTKTITITTTVKCNSSATRHLKYCLVNSNGCHTRACVYDAAALSQKIMQIRSQRYALTRVRIPPQTIAFCGKKCLGPRPSIYGGMK